MLKKILLTLAVIAVLASAGLYYINKILLPVQIKGLILKTAEDALGRKVTFDTLQYSVLNGLVIADLTVYSKENPEEVFVHIDRASAQVFFPALLRKKIILPYVRVDNLSARVIRLNAHAWNFSDLLAPKPDAPASDNTPAAKPLNVIISGLSVNNARVRLTDLVGGDGFTEMIEPVNIKGSLNLAGSIHLAGEAKIPSTKATIAFDVHAGMRNHNIKTELRLENIVTDKYLRFAPEGLSIPVKTLTIAKTGATILMTDNGLTISGSALLNNIDAEPAPGFKTRGALELDTIFLTLGKNTLNLQGTIVLRGASLEMNNGRTFSASLRAAGTTFSMKNKDWKLSTDVDIQGLTAIIGAEQKVRADITLARLSAAQAGADITAKGDIAIKNFTAQMPGISIQSALSAPGAIFEFSQGAIDITARPVFSMLDISLPEGLGFNCAPPKDPKIQGGPAVAAHAAIPPAGQGEPRYDGTVQLNACALRGVPVVGDIRDIRGTLQIKTNQALLKNAAFSVLGAPVEIGGTLKDFSDPVLDLAANAQNIDLGLIGKIIPQVIKDNGLTITGKADIHADITGKASALDKGGLKLTSTLKNVNIQSGKLKQALNNINGTLVYDPPTLTWKGLTLEFQDKTCTLNGYLENFLNPLVATSIKAGDLNLDTRIKKTGDILAVESLDATWFDSSANATGKVFIPPGKAATMDMTATAKASLRDLPKMLPAYAKQVEALKLAGILKITTHIKGNPVDWQNLESTFNIATPAVNILGYEADAVTLDATQNNGELRPLEIKGKLYDGDFGVIGSVDLARPDFPFESTFKLDRTNLELLKRDTPLKNQQLSGALTIAGELKGAAGSLKSLDGKATVQITDGYLWDLEILSKILSILSSSFQGGSLIIREANATININDGKLETNNLTLKSPTVSLIGEGWLDMQDQTIDLNITPRLETPAANGTGTDLLSLINPTQGLVNIHLTGTLSKPRFDHNISTPTVIKKTLQNTVSGLLKLFQ